MTALNWGNSQDGKFEVLSLTRETLDGAMDVIRNSFFLYENVSIGVELHKNPKASQELEELCLRAGRDGVSLVAIEKSTGKVAAAAFNKIQVPAKPGEENYFENYAASCNEASSKALIQFMIDADAECDLFEFCKIDCILEIMFIATLPEYQRKGLCKQLYSATISLARKLHSGENVKVPINSEPLPIGIPPKIVACISTSLYTQKTTKSLNFSRAVEIDYNRWSFNGKTFAERIGPDTPTTSLDYIRL